jgi:CRP/FNR family cyclic AMP-dependent transcriptional regulator
MTAKSDQGAFDPREFLAKVGEGKTIVAYSKDEVVFAQGDAADTIYYIQKGRLKVVVISEQGKEAVVGMLEPGQFFGEGCLNGHSLRIATTTAMESCLVTAISKIAMLAALHGEPKFSELFMAHLLTRNSRIEEDLIDQLFNSSEKRLARLLLLLANFGKEGSPQPISPNISQIPQTRLHQLQRKNRSPQLASERGVVRQAGDPARAVDWPPFDHRPIAADNDAGCDNPAHEVLDTFPSATERSRLPPVSSTAVHERI